MITIDLSTAANRGGSFDPNFKLIRDAVNKNVLVINTLRKNSAEAIPPDHLLLKILDSMSVSSGSSDSELYYKMRDRVYSISNALKLVSPTNFGAPQYGVMMSGCSEAIFLHASEFEPEPWAALKPIEFVYHEETNLNGLFDNSKRTDTMAYISINLYMLAKQYLGWLKWRNESGSSDSTRSFLFKYPMTNAIYSYLDISLFNRLLSTLMGWDVYKDATYTQRNLLDVNPMVSRYVTRTIDVNVKQLHTIGQVLYNTEMIYKRDATGLIPKIDTMLTRQCKWFFELTKLPLIIYANELSKPLNPKYNDGLLSVWRRELKNSVDDSVWSRLPAAASHIKERFLVNFYKV